MEDSSYEDLSCIMEAFICQCFGVHRDNELIDKMVFNDFFFIIFVIFVAFAILMEVIKNNIKHVAYQGFNYRGNDPQYRWNWY